MSRLSMLAAAATGLVLTACAAPRVGVADLDILSAQGPDETITSNLSVQALSGCFQERADFLPFSRFVTTGDIWRYSLSGYGAAYESVTIRPEGTGSVAEIRTGRYDRRWIETFNRDRGSCLADMCDSDHRGVMTTTGTSLPTPRLRDRSATEAAIVDAAERLLLREGWSAVNVQTVAAEAGVDRKLVYRYFDGVDGVIDRLATTAELWLGTAMAEAPPSQATSYRAFAREMLMAYLDALRRNPVVLRLLAWELTQDTPLLRRLEARRSLVLQDWVKARRLRLRLPPEGDLPALNAVLLGAVQHLALSAARRGEFAGVALDAPGWTRIEAALDRLLAAYPD